MPDSETIVDDPDDPSMPATDRAPTRPLPPLKGARIEVDFADADAAASFLDVVARILRERKRLVITIE